MIGSPNSLLYDAGLAWHPSGASTAARRSFVEVFPVEPVMPTTSPVVRGSRRACQLLQPEQHVVDPHDGSAHGRCDAEGLRHERDARAFREGGTDEFVAVAFAVQRDEARARFEEARVERPRRDERVR